MRDYYIKPLALLFLLFVETVFATQLISDFVEVQNYLAVSIEYMLGVAVLYFVIAITFTFLLCSDHKSLLYVVTPAVVVLGMSLPLASFDIRYVAGFLGICFLFMVMEIYKAQQFKHLLVKNNYALIFKMAIKTLLTAIGLASALIIMLTPSMGQYNFGKKVAELVAAPVQKALEDQLGTSGSSIDLNSIYQSQGTSKEAVNAQIKQMGIPIDLEALDKGETPKIDFATIIESKVNTVVEPYKMFIRPLIAMLVYGLFHFIGSIAVFFYGFLVGPIFALAAKLGIVKVERIMVEKEVISL